MIQKQINFLDQFKRDMMCTPQEQLVVGAKYKNGNHMLTAHDLTQEQWIDFVAMNDKKGLWQEADRYLKNL